MISFIHWHWVVLSYMILSYDLPHTNLSLNALSFISILSKHILYISNTTNHLAHPSTKESMQIYIHFHIFILIYKNIKSGQFTSYENHNGNRYKTCLVVCHKSNTFGLKCGCQAAALLLFITNFTRTYTNISEYILQK